MFKNNFIRLCNKNNVSPSFVCQKIGLSNSVFTQWTDKTVPRKATLMKIADYFNVSVDYLLGIENASEKEEIKGIKIPVIGNVIAGVPISAIEEILDYEEITEKEAATGEFFALRIKGNSMEPKISENDVVIVKQQSSVENGEIAIVLVNGQDATCKKIMYHSNGISLLSLNQSYPPMFYTSEECETLPVRIIGKVVELRAKF